MQVKYRLFDFNRWTPKFVCQTWLLCQQSYLYEFNSYSVHKHNTKQKFQNGSLRIHMEYIYDFLEQQIRTVPFICLNILIIFFFWMKNLPRDKYVFSLGVLGMNHTDIVIQTC